MGFEILLLRLVHLFAGAYWVGVGLFSVFFFTPTIQQTGPDGQTVIRHLVGKTRFSQSMNIAAILATFSGGFLFWINSGHLDYNWLSTPQAKWLAIGSSFGIAAYLVSALVQSRSARRIRALGETIAAGGNPPTPGQVMQLRLYQQRLIRGAQVTAALLVVTLAAMATWRYAY